MSSQLAKYYIGIDFGAGETSASYYDVCEQRSANDGEKLHRLSIVNTGDVYKVYSAIRFSNNRWQLLTNPNDFSYSDVDADFKKKVCEMSIEQKENNKTFWWLVFSSILEANKDFLKYDKVTGDRNFMLAVARPSSWTQKDEDEYLALMREAGLPVDRIMKESDAALAKWSQRAGNGITLVVDCGSSTVDLTLVCDGKPYEGPLFDCEPPHGAQRIEELLLDELKKDPQVDDACKDVTNHLLLSAPKLNLDKAIKLYVRKVKEEYYTHSPAGVYFSLKKRPFTNGAGDILDSTMSGETFEETVSPYFEDLQSFFQNVYDTLNRDGIKISSIVLSGGASRMPRVKSILTSVFGLKDADIFHDRQDADYVVSDGLALSAGYAVGTDTVAVLVEESHNTTSEVGRTPVTIQDIVRRLTEIESNISSFFSQRKSTAKTQINDSIQELLLCEKANDNSRDQHLEKALSYMIRANENLKGDSSSYLCVQIARTYSLFDNRYDLVLKWAEESCDDYGYPSDELKDVLKTKDYDDLVWQFKSHVDNSDPLDDPVWVRILIYD